MSCESYSEVQHSSDVILSSGGTDVKGSQLLMTKTPASPGLESSRLTGQSSPYPLLESEAVSNNSATPNLGFGTQSSSSHNISPHFSAGLSELISTNSSSTVCSANTSPSLNNQLPSLTISNSSTFTPILPAPLTSPTLSSVSSPLPVLPTVAHPVPSLASSGDVKIVSSNNAPKTISVVPSSSTGGVNGLGSKIVQVASGVGSGASITYVGTLIKKGKEAMAQKVVLTPVRSKDGAITRLILPKSRTSDTQAVGSRFILPKGRGGISFPTPRSFIVQSGRGGSAAPVRPLPPPSAPVRHMADTLPRAIFSSADLTVAAILPTTEPESNKKKPFGGTMINGGVKMSTSVEPSWSQSKQLQNNSRSRPRDTPAENSSTNSSSGTQDVTVVSVDLDSSDENTLTEETVCEKSSENNNSSSSAEVQISNTLHIPEQPVSGPQFLLPLLEVGSTSAESKVTTKTTPSVSQAPAKSKKSQVLSQHVVKLPSGLQAVVQIVSSNTPGQPIMSGQASMCVAAPAPQPGSMSVGQATALLVQPSTSQVPLSSPQEATSPADSSSEAQPALPSAASEAPENCTIPAPRQTTPEPQIDLINEASPLSPIETPTQTPQEKVNQVSATTTSPISNTNASNSSVSILQSKKTGTQIKSKFLGQHSVVSVGGRVSEDRRKRKHLPISKEGRKTIAVKRLEPLPGAVNVDPLQIIQWDPVTSIGTLPGSQIKFVMNCYGGLQVFDVNRANDAAFSRLSTSSESKEEKDEICRCVQCQCYGLVAEFVDKKYCSTLCRDEFLTTKAFVRKRELILDNTGSHLLTPTKRKLLERALGQSNHLPSSAALSPPPPAENCQAVKPTQVAKAPNEGRAVPHPPSPPEETLSTQSSPVPSPSVPPTTKQVLPESDLPPSPPVSLNQPAKVEESDTFDWHSYLEKTSSSAAWVRLFPEPFPCSANIFIPGQRLEALDPSNQSAVCVASIAQVNGYRLRIHFDGYSSESDFWVNASSPDIMPCGWAETCNMPLSVPPGWEQETFTWAKYFASVPRGPAPKEAFLSLNENAATLFETGMKIEAVDRKNQSLVCVATVAAVIGSRIRVHFDSWDDHYDYWCDSSSPLIRPVGWCKTNRVTLTPPNRWGRPFSWPRYLSVTGSRAAPCAAFTPRPPIMWRRGTKLEAVDPRAPAFVSVATVTQVLPYQVRLTFDGMPSHYGWWYDDDSSLLHPVGWCQRTGTDLSPPPNAVTISLTRCPTGACNGRGNFNDNSMPNHVTVAECPYTPDRVDSLSSHTRSLVIQSSSRTVELEDGVATAAPPLPREIPSEEIVESTQLLKEDVESNLPIAEHTFNPPDESPLPQEEDSKLTSSVSSPVAEDSRDVMDCDEMESSSQDLSFYGPQISSETVPDVMTWDCARVTRLVETAVGSVTDEWMYHSIDGEAFLMLLEKDLIKTLNFSSSDASLIMNLITSCQNKFICV